MDKFIAAGRPNDLSPAEDASRDLLENQAVDVYDAGTLTRSTLYVDSAKSATRANPFLTTSLGNYPNDLYLEPGDYDFVSAGTTYRVNVPDPPEVRVATRSRSAVAGAGGQALLDLVFNVTDSPRMGGCMVEVVVAKASDSSLQAHYLIERITAGASGRGGATTVVQLLAPPVGLTSSAGDIAVSRPTADSVRVTLTNAGTDPVNVTFVISSTHRLRSATTSSSVSTVPGPPTMLGATRGDQQVLVTFTAPTFQGGSAVSSYTARRYVGGVLSGTVTGIPTAAAGASNGWLDTGRTNGLSHDYEILAVNAQGTSAPSARSNAVIPAGVPGTPAAAVIAAGANKITVTPPALPSANGSPITGWEVELIVAGVPESPKQRFASPTTPFDIPNRPPSAHTVKVAAYNSVGVGAQSPASNSVTPTSGGGGGTLTALLVAEVISPLSASSEVWRLALVAAGYADANITKRLASDAEDAGTYTVGVVAPDAVSVGTKYRGKAYPFVMACPSLWEEWDAADGSNVGTYAVDNGYVLAAHGALGSLGVGFHTWRTGAADQTQHAPATVAPLGVKLQVEDPDPGWHNVRSMAFEAGTAKLNGRSAAARQVLFAWSTAFYSALTADGNAAIAGSLAWAVPGPAAAPNKPTPAPTLSLRDSTSLTVSWSAPNDNGSPILEYEVKAWRQNDGVLVHTGTGITTTSYAMTGLATSVLVYVQVRARNAVGWSVGSDLSTAVAPQPGGGGLTVVRTVGVHGYEGWADATLNGGHGDEFDLYVLQAWEHDVIPRIRARNPRAKVVCYKDFSLRPGHIGGYDSQGYPLYPTMADSDAAPESWFLHNGGSRIQMGGWIGSYFSDIGNTAFRDHCVSHLLAELTRNGWDGIFQDNAAMNFVPGYGVPDAYPSTAAWKVPLFAFLGALGPALSGAGKLHVMNQGSTSFTESEIGDQLDACGASPLSTGGWEYWGQWHHEYGSPIDPYWVGVSMSWMKAAMDRDLGFLCLGLSHAYPFPSLMTWERAMQLIEWDGVSPTWLALHREDSTPYDIWHPAYTIDVGLPTSGKLAVGAGVRKNYDSGTVLLNANDFSNGFDLGQTYVRPDNGQFVSSVTLGPREGLILRTP